ncbi:MAG: restriction endonuclease subunit S [Prevotella sp.]|nr:restriction endonuclease subunit S [Prevotella sp.]
MSEWKEVRLGDYIDMTNGYAFKSKSFVNRGIPVLKIKNIKTNKIIIEDIDYISADDNNPRYTIIKPNDLIITMTGNRIDGAPETWVGKVALFNLDGKYFLNQRLSIIRVKKDLVNLLFILYSLTTIDAQKYFITHATSSGGQANISPDIVKNFTIKLPSYIIQSEIAGILSSLDAKIETNNKLNEKLEEMAQAIFKSWFVDFEPFKDKPFHETELGMIPEGWEVLSLTDIATFTNGLAMQKFRPNYKEPHLPVLKIKELRQGFCDDTSEICIDDISENFIANNGDVIFSWSGTLLVDIWCGEKCGVNQHLFKVTSEKYNKWFFYFWIKRHLAEFIRIAKDKAVTMGHIKRGHLTNALVVVPNEKTMQNADKIFTPIIDKIIEAKIESKRLASLRDTLLPRLMSGELIV